MITISLCMIVKNEGDTLERCLESVGDIADEIIIVDTGSTDKTKEIARQFTDKVYDFKWIDDFSAARNYSYEKAQMDYIMWLDADDVILSDDRDKLKDLKRTLDPTVDIVMLKYNVGVDAQGNVALSYFRERLSKRSGNFTWYEPVHEHIQMSGIILEADINIIHNKMHASSKERNLKIYEKFLSQGRELTPRGLYYYARELKDHKRYADAIKYFTKFLDTEKGYVEDNICACNELAECYSIKNDWKNSLKSMLRSFEYDTPRAELCCQLGYYYKNRVNYNKAIFWFKLASILEKPKNSWGFIKQDCWTYIPYIELCVCYDKLGNINEAIEYNNKAAEYKPDDPAVLYNRKYFEGLKA